MGWEKFENHPAVKRVMHRWKKMVKITIVNLGMMLKVKMAVYDATNSGGQGGISEQMGVPMKVETKWPYDVFEFKGDDKYAVMINYWYMPWMSVWQSMQSQGWRVACGPGEDLYYLRPGFDSFQGDYGEAFVNEEDVKKIAKFGWKGEKLPPVSAK
jgi:hypothetical protein